MDLRHVWIIHNNCKNACSHCLHEPSPPSNVAETEKMIDNINKLGIASRLYYKGSPHEELLLRHSDMPWANCYGDPGGSVESDMANGSPREIIYGLHGPDAETHEIMAPKGDFDRVISSLEQLRDRSAEATLSLLTILHADNYTLFDSMCRLFSALGCTQVHMLKLSYGGRAKKLPKSLYMTSEQTVTFLNMYFRLKQEYRSIEFVPTGNWGPLFSRSRKLYYRLFEKFGVTRACGVAERHVAVTSGSGEIFPCRHTTYLQPLKMGSFSPGKGLVIDRDWMEDFNNKVGEPCKSCEIINVCRGGCRASAISSHYQEHGILDFYAGFPDCPVHLGITPVFDMRDDILSIAKKGRKILSKFIPGL